MQTRLGDLVSMTKGTTATQKAAPGEYPLVVTAANFLTSNEYQFEGEAVCVPLVSSTGHGHASLKRVHYASGKFAVANIISALQKLPDAQVDMKYLHLLLDHERGSIIVPLMKGTANVSLSQKALAGASVNLPPVPDQRRIVDLIGAVDDAIASAEASLGASTNVFGAMADEYLKSADELVELDSVARVLRGAVWSKTDEVNSPTTEHEEVIGIAVTSATGLDLSKMKFVRGLGPKVNRVETGDLLVVGSNGNPQRIGNTYQTSELVGRAFSAFQMAVRPNTTAFSSAIYFALASPQAQATMTARTAGSTGLKNLGVGGLRQVRIPDPSTEHASVWSDRLHAAQQVEMANSKALAATRELRANLLSALLSGEHEIPASYDELLEVNA